MQLIFRQLTVRAPALGKRKRFLLTMQKSFAIIPCMTAAERLVRHYGDRHKAAAALGLNKETIRLWLERGIPLGKAVEVERACGGVVTAEQILREHKAVA